jgi:hypothetical protein
MRFDLVMLSIGMVVSFLVVVAVGMSVTTVQRMDMTTSCQTVAKRCGDLK